MRTRFGFTLALVRCGGRSGEGQHEQGRGPEAHGPNTPRANQGHVPTPEIMSMSPI